MSDISLNDVFLAQPISAAPWDITQAIELAIKLEEIAAQCNAHVALTGGVLYKQGLRKDVDFVIYNHRKEIAIDKKLFISKLKAICIYPFGDWGRVVKANYKPEGVDNRQIDFLFPDQNEGNYV